ncbi:MAG: phosphoserine transaminase [Pyrinomonadaceae bacterium]|nr:phosphoserine transaminase [Pyrinomonadaceae bacterium]
MNKGIYNFSAGPSMIPPEVLQRAQNELLDFNGIGMGVMEISHRSLEFEEVMRNAQNSIRELMNLPEDFHVLFLQGGASLQFSMIPMNFLRENESADYVVTGTWGEKAVKDAKLFGNVNTVFNSRPTDYKSVAREDEIKFNENAAYIHYTSNETIEGVEFKYDLNGGKIPVVCDASSNIMSKPFDVSKYDLIYAGAQKNLGPSGVTVVIIRDEFMQRAKSNVPRMLDYKVHVENNSMANTPNTFGIYMLGLVCDWIKEKGGLEAMRKLNEAKAKVLYDALDASDGFYIGHAAKEARSMMNVTFRLPDEKLEREFVNQATANGFDGLKGHRSVGGIRASIYNAFPLVGVEKLVEFMRDFRRGN